MNHWTAAPALVDTFVRDGVSIPQELVWRTLAPRIGESSLAILDLGGGDAALAVRLAVAGHAVTLVDIDPRMLDHAARRIAALPHDIARRIRLIEGDASALAGLGSFDLVCCHSVLMYEADAAPIVAAIVAACRPAALLSIVAVNPAALAMRAGLAGRWNEALTVLCNGQASPGRYALATYHPREAVEAMLRDHGAAALDWSGIGIFTDHHDGPIDTDDPAALLEAEWHAGRHDPYRGVARCYHLLARAGADGSATASV